MIWVEGDVRICVDKRNSPLDTEFTFTFKIPPAHAAWKEANFP